MIEEFRQFISDDELRCYGPLVRQWPKWSFERSALSQFGMGVVGAAVAAGCLAVSFMVVVSDKPGEQLPFQQAMWGFAAVGGILCLYGLASGAWRATLGIADVGRWWLLFERGLVIVNNGKLQHSGPLDALTMQTSVLTGEPKLLDAEGRSLPLPQWGKEGLIEQVQILQRKVPASYLAGGPSG